MRMVKIAFFLMLVTLVSAGPPAFSADPKAKVATKGAVDECVEPAAGPIAAKQPASGAPVAQSAEASSSAAVARVGFPAPDFEAPSYQNGGFKNIKLSDFKGKWVVLCFYPGDFTFV